MKLESIKLENFKAFQKLEIKNAPSMGVFIGKNGVGKSTLLQVYGFLKDALEHDLSTALSKLGGVLGFKEVRTRGVSGNIKIEIKFRKEPKSPIITYLLEIGEKDGNPIVKREVLSYRRSQHGRPWAFLDFTEGKGKAVTNEVENVKDESKLIREEQSLKSKDILAIKGLSQFEKFPAVVALGNLIENWHISDFQINRARSVPEYEVSKRLSKDGSNLPLVVNYLHKNHPKRFRQILTQLSRRVPGINEIQTKVTEEGKVLLKFKDEAFQEPFLSQFVSDGTIKMLAYLVLLYDPDPRPLLCVEEPENQLYPDLLPELAEEFRAYANRGGQVFVSTHSPDFLNAVEIDEVFYLVKSNGVTRIERASENTQVCSYMKEGDKLGNLWKEGLLDQVIP